MFTVTSPLPVNNKDRGAAFGRATGINAAVPMVTELLQRITVVESELAAQQKLNVRYGYRLAELEKYEPQNPQALEQL